MMNIWMGGWELVDGEKSGYCGNRDIREDLKEPI
jgi:hypothetical protein